MSLDAIVAGRSRVLVQQTKEWGEILLGFESKNRFELKGDHGERLGYAAEEAKGLGQWFLRNLLGRCRAAKIHVYGPDGQPAGRGEKPFTWILHRIEAFDGERRIGAVQRKWTWFHRRFVIENAAGQEVMEIVSPFFQVWTFTLRFQGQECGVIRKKWGGMLKEFFTDTDAFGVEWREHVPDEVRKLLLIATFLIDFTCFENNSSGWTSVLD